MTVNSGLRSYPFEPFTGDLPAELLEMVVAEPVSRVRLPDGRAAWLVLGYEDCCTVLADPAFPAAAGRDGDTGRRRTPRAEHGRSGARRGAAGGRPRVHRPAHRDVPARVQRLVDELVDAMLAGPRPADVVAGLAGAAAGARGVPGSASRPPTGPGSTPGSRAELGHRVRLGRRRDRAGRAAGLPGRAARAQRAEPGDDLLSAWVRGGGARELVDAELVELAMGVLLGGLEINSTSAGLRALFQHPEQLAKLRAAPGKLAAATDEILRYTSVSAMFRVQVVREDLVLGGVAMRAGDCVMAIPWAGNRDPRFFPSRTSSTSTAGPAYRT
ncbi:cytochrome P450 [Micromonospora sp. BRA006-A]|nr:cytochrome P450 [Micromonospora sp. BRA006-A]